MSADPIVSHREIKAGSNRAFGVVFAIVFAVIGCYPLISTGSVRWWALAASAIMLIVTFAAPNVLAPFNRAWHRLGLVMHMVVGPVVMGFIFVIAVIPTGLVLRAVGKDILRLKPRPAADTYWLTRSDPGPPRGTMSNQF